MNICHLTSAHTRFDTRIYLKMAKSLSYTNHNVSICCADNLGSKKINNILIYDVRKTINNRFARMLITPIKMLFKASSLKVDIFHIHDPELLIIGLLLKINGYAVVYDSHEDVSLQILSKEYLPKFLRILISKLFTVLENSITSKLDSVISATESISEKFKNIISVQLL